MVHTDKENKRHFFAVRVGLGRRYRSVPVSYPFQPRSSWGESRVVDSESEDCRNVVSSPGVATLAVKRKVRRRTRGGRKRLGKTRAQLKRSVRRRQSGVRPAGVVVQDSSQMRPARGPARSEGVSLEVPVLRAVPSEVVERGQRAQVARVRPDDDEGSALAMQSITMSRRRRGSYVADRTCSWCGRHIGVSTGCPSCEGFLMTAQMDPTSAGWLRWIRRFRR